MDERDKHLAWRTRDIIAVITEDVDAVTFEVEDGVAYIEGVVPTDEQRQAISKGVRRLDGLTHVITCLATEHVMPPAHEQDKGGLYPAPVARHYHSLS